MVVSSEWGVSRSTESVDDCEPCSSFLGLDPELSQRWSVLQFHARKLQADGDEIYRVLAGAD